MPCAAHGRKKAALQNGRGCCAYCFSGFRPVMLFSTGRDCAACLRRIGYVKTRTRGCHKRDTMAAFAVIFCVASRCSAAWGFSFCGHRPTGGRYAWASWWARGTGGAAGVVVFLGAVRERQSSARCAHWRSGDFQHGAPLRSGGATRINPACYLVRGPGDTALCQANGGREFGFCYQAVDGRA